MTDRSLSPLSTQLHSFPGWPQCPVAEEGTRDPGFPAHLVFSWTEHFFVKSVARESWEGWQERPLFPRLLLGALTAWFR